MRRLFLLIVLLFLTLPVQAQDLQEFSIADILLQSASAEEAEFTILLFVISEIDFDLLDSLGRTDNEWTVLAPSDAAFIAFMEANDLSVGDLIENQDLLREILNYHIIEGALSYADLAELEELETRLADSMITITFEDNLLLNDSTEIIVENVAANNGIIHVLDRVLLPPNALDIYSLPKPEATVEPETEATEEAGD
jgi:transforming growth factor-beta-induced protein